MYIEYNVCSTMVDINYLNSSNSETGLFLVTKTTLAYCYHLHQWTGVTVGSAELTNARMELNNEGEWRVPLRSGVMYTITFSGVRFSESAMAKLAVTFIPSVLK